MLFSRATVMDWRDVAENTTMQKLTRIIMILIHYDSNNNISHEKIFCCIAK